MWYFCICFVRRFIRITTITGLTSHSWKYLWCIVCEIDSLFTLTVLKLHVPVFKTKRYSIAHITGHENLNQMIMWVLPHAILLEILGYWLYLFNMLYYSYYYIYIQCEDVTMCNGTEPSDVVVMWFQSSLSVMWLISIPS